VDQVVNFWEQFLGSLRWTVLGALLLIALIQIIYLTWVNLSANRTPGGRRRRRQPSAPIMPTQPDNLVPSDYADPSGGVSAARSLNPSDNRVVRPRMVILNGLPAVSEIDLPADEFGIGRFYNPDHNILVALDERSVSRRHAYFSKAGSSEYYLTDTSSSYGTSLRQGDTFQSMTPGQEERVFNGDVVQFGSVVTVRLVLPGDTRAYATQV
jgi:pSer/pThr/pTyr-binding forkhead associated (FHA) protein